MIKYTVTDGREFVTVRAYSEPEALTQAEKHFSRGVTLRVASPSDFVHVVREHAGAHYNEDGWDYVVEAFDDKYIIEIIRDARATTVKTAINAVHQVVKIKDEYRKDIEGEGRF